MFGADFDPLHWVLKGARVLRMLVQFVLVLFIVRLVLRAIAPFRIKRGAGAAPQPKTADLVLDAVCNTYVPRDRALRAMVGGREQHFCSPECRAKAALQFNPVS